MMQTGLDDLPVEIHEAIVAHLALSDICSLRLTAQKVAAKSSQGCFKAHFVTKTVHLSSLKELELFRDVTQTGWQGCGLQHLKVVGPTLSASQANDIRKWQNRTTAHLFATALTNLRMSSPCGRLGSLILSVENSAQHGPSTQVIPVYDWKAVWEGAGHTFEIASHALQASAIPVEKLDVFGNIDECSLSLDRFRSVSDFINLLDSTKALKDVSLSLSNHETRNLEDKTSESLTKPGLELSKSVSQFLRQCPGLERLRLSWYNWRLIDLSSAEQEERRFFNYIVETKAMPLLQKVTLEGIYTSEETLVSFVENHTNLRSVTLKELHLESGTFRPVFDRMVASLNNLNSVHFNDLWESRLIQFPSARGKPHFSHPGGPTWMVRMGPKARQSIQYQLVEGHIKDSGKSRRWYRQKERRYGPPYWKPQCGRGTDVHGNFYGLRRFA